MENDKEFEIEYERVKTFAIDENFKLSTDRVVMSPENFKMLCRGFYLAGKVKGLREWWRP